MTTGHYNPDNIATSVRSFLNVCNDDYAQIKGSLDNGELVKFVELQNAGIRKLSLIIEDQTEIIKELLNKNADMLLILSLRDQTVIEGYTQN